MRGKYNWHETEEMKELNPQFVTLLQEEQEPAEWAEKREQLEAQIQQFVEQQGNSEEDEGDSSDTTDGENEQEPNPAANEAVD